MKELPKDSMGSLLEIGSFVLYTPTGTKGNIVEIMKDEEGIWALLDKTNLYYKTEVLTIIKEIKEKVIVEKIFTREEAEETLEKEKEAAKISEMSDVSLESGG